MGELFEKSKPYVAMISMQFGYAGMNIITKVSLTRGMNHFVLVVYRHAFATIALAPFAFFVERKVRPKLTFYTFCQIFVLGLLGPVLDQNFYYLGLKLTTPTFACALSNLLPAMTFVMALIFRMEKVNIKNIRSQAKIVGTILSVGGAMLMTLYKGPTVPMPWSPHHHSHETSLSGTTAIVAVSNKNWIIGSLLIIAGTLAWSAFFILQAAVQKKYSAPLSLTTSVCFLGTLQATVVGAAMVHELPRWKLGWDINLLAAVYAGVVTSALAYYIQGLCMRTKGPVFATAFTPLMMIIVAIMSSIILSESILLGSVLGGVLIATGIYCFLWGKLKDNKIPLHKNCSEVFSDSEVILSEIQNKLDDIEVGSNKLMSKGPQPHQFSAEAISVTANDNPKT
jgi:drug/metabolite transporter (DMT)-like permease